MPYLIETLKFESTIGFQELLRNTVASLVALANTGNAQALSALVEIGIPSIDPPRAPLALGVGTVAIRNTLMMLSFLEQTKTSEGAIKLIAEGFDMLEETLRGRNLFAADAPWDLAGRRIRPTLAASDRRSSTSWSSERGEPARKTFDGTNTYELSSSYGVLDPFKRRARIAGRSTADVLRHLQASQKSEMSRGESAYLVATPRDGLPSHMSRKASAPRTSSPMRCTASPAGPITTTSHKMPSR